MPTVPARSALQVVGICVFDCLLPFFFALSLSFGVLAQDTPLAQTERKLTDELISKLKANLHAIL